MNIGYSDLMGIGKNLSMALKTGFAKLVSLVVTLLHWLVVGNVGPVSDRDHVAESTKKMKKSESLPDIATKVAQMNDHEVGEIAECPLTPVIAHQDTTPVSRRGSPQREKSVEKKPKKTNTFVMVEYRDGSDTVGFRDTTSPYSDSPSSATHVDATNFPDCLKDSTFYDTPVGQQYVVVEVPRDETEMKKKKKKKKQRAKGKKEEQGTSTQPASCDQIEKNSSSISTPPCGQGVGMELRNTPESNTCAASLDAEIGFLKSSTDSNMVPISNNIFSSEDSIDTGASFMSEQQHESELEKAWKTASLAAAKLGLDTFGEDTSLTRQSSHPIDTSDSMNSSRLSHVSWGTSMDSSLSFGSPLHSTSGKKSSSFKNIKDIWEKSA